MCCSMYKYEEGCVNINCAFPKQQKQNVSMKFVIAQNSKAQS